MMLRTAPGTRATLGWLLLLACLLGISTGAVRAFAGEEPPPDAAAADEEGAPPAEEGMSVGALEEVLNENPKSFAALLLVKFVPIAIGLVLLILWWLKRDKIRGGALPPPPRVEPTVTFSAAAAYALAFGAMLLAPAVIGVGIAPGGDPKAIPLWQSMIVMGVCTLPLSFVILWRRSLMQRASTPDREALFPTDTPNPTPAPRFGRAVGLSFWTYCVATFVVVPVGMVWVLVLELSGMGAELQDLVTRVMEPQAAYEPWVIAFFGICIAPFTEECIFRGMLYPATRRAFGGTRQAAWRAAVLVSLVFAVIHLSVAAILPLFALAMVLTWIMERTNSLAACILAHALHNAFSLVPLLVLKYA